MSLYLDTSCLWKLLITESGSVAVEAAIEHESEVTISSLAELEAEQRLIADRLGGKLTFTRYRTLCEKLAGYRAMAPFVHSTVNGDIAALARKQIRQSKAYCRTADCLHLAAMEGLGLRKLLTNDDKQADAARALGFVVILPR